MPNIKIEKVSSFSSEDPNYPASNILSPDHSKKWKCRTVGEKSANVVLQLETATQITNIDIGNEYSAYVEVLVARSSSADDFKVLLVMSCFMTPLESRQSSNPNKVRMFTYDQLMSPERDEKWDRVKIVCTQPFNRHVQYGLSFVKLHCSDGVKEMQPIGKFSVRAESPVNIIAGSLFAKRKELEENKPITAAAAIREASSSTDVNSTKLKLQITQKTPSEPSNSRYRKEILYKEEDDEPNSKIDSLIEKRDLEKREKQAKEFIEKLEREAKMHREKEKKQKELEEKEKKAKKQSKDKGESSKRKINTPDKPNKKQKIKKIKRPFNQLMGDVVFVISGIQNPERANLRATALSMGAKYKSDWDNTCTHLICAFVNTPKFNQVKGRGKIVTRKWIPDCSSLRKRLPWRRYALDRNDQGRSESEEEICEDIGSSEDDDDDDARDNKNGSDTEDEIEKVQKKWKRNQIIDSPPDSPTGSNMNVESRRDSQSDCVLVSPTPPERIVIDNDDDDDHDGDVIEEDDKSKSNDDKSFNIYECDTDVEDDELKRTSLKIGGDDSNGSAED